MFSSSLLSAAVPLYTQNSALIAVESSPNAAIPSASAGFDATGNPALDLLCWKQSALFDHALKIGRSDPMAYAEARSQMGDGLCFIRPVFELGDVTLRDRVTALREFGGTRSPEHRGENIRTLLRFLESTPDTGETHLRNRILRLFAIEALSRFFPEAPLKETCEAIQWLLNEARDKTEVCPVALRKDLPENDPHRVAPLSADLRRPLRLLLFKALEEAQKSISSSENEEHRNLSKEIANGQKALMIEEMMGKQKVGLEISMSSAGPHIGFIPDEVDRFLAIIFLMFKSPKTPAFLLGAALLGAALYGFTVAAEMVPDQATFLMASAIACAVMGVGLLGYFSGRVMRVIRDAEEAQKQRKIMSERRKEIEGLEHYRNYFIELDLRPSFMDDQRNPG